MPKQLTCTYLIIDEVIYILKLDERYLAVHGKRGKQPHQAHAIRLVHFFNYRWIEAHTVKMVVAVNSTDPKIEDHALSTIVLWKVPSEPMRWLAVVKELRHTVFEIYCPPEGRPYKNPRKVSPIAQAKVFHNAGKYMVHFDLRLRGDAFNLSCNLIGTRSSIYISISVYLFPVSRTSRW